MKNNLMLALLVMLVATATSTATQNEKAAADALWIQALSAKGGLAKLEQVRNFVVTEKTTYSDNKLDPGFTRQRLYALPSRIWEFVDHRPGQLGFGLGVVLDLENPVQWTSNGAIEARQEIMDSATYNLLQG